jgi:REP element-mobilizing transposase RayT
MEEEHIYKSHNKTLLLYHLVFPVKYRRSVIIEQVGESLTTVCLELSKRYEIHFVEIGYEENHVHYLVQSVPTMSISKIVRTIKSITGKELYRRHPEIKQKLWGGNVWTSGYYANTVGRYGNKEVIQHYIKNQGEQSNYIELHRDQLGFFE